jgi:hypothetical protein
MVKHKRIREIIDRTTEKMRREYQPDEFRVDPHKNDIPYGWKRKDG